MGTAGAAEPSNDPGPAPRMVEPVGPRNACWLWRASMASRCPPRVSLLTLRPWIPRFQLHLGPSLSAYLQLGPGAVHQRQEALCSFRLCRKHKLLEILRGHVQICLGIGGHGGYGPAGQGPQSTPVTCAHLYAPIPLPTQSLVTCTRICRAQTLFSLCSRSHSTGW